MNVLVTGGLGFIGRHVAWHAARRGHTVRVLARPARRERDFAAHGHETVYVDLRDRDLLPAALAGIDAVVHSAASMATDRAAQQADTVGGTDHLLGAMQRAGVRRIVGISTLALYDHYGIAAGSVLDEDSPLEEDVAARGPYVHAKRQQEDAIRSRATDNGWWWTIVRPGIVFGTERTWFHHLGVRLNPRLWVVYSPAALLPLTHVDNCADAIVRTLETEAAHGATLNLVDDDLPDRLQYVRRLAHAATPRPTVLTVPWHVLDRLSRGASWAADRSFRTMQRLPDLLRPHELHARCKPLRYSNRRARSLLQWQPRIGWMQGLDEAVAQRSRRASASAM